MEISSILDGAEEKFTRKQLGAKEEMAEIFI